MKLTYVLDKLEEVNDQLALANQAANTLSERLHTLDLSDKEKSELVALCQEILETIEVVRHG